MTTLLLFTLSAPLAAFALNLTGDLTNLTAGLLNFTSPDVFGTGSLFGQSIYPNLTSCLAQPPVYSCENTTVIEDLCCSPYPGGLQLSTQFWDTYTGFEEQGQLLPGKLTWTLHGLWPDFCNGSYTQYCDFSRQFDPDPSPKTQNGLPNGTVVPPYPANAPGVDTFVEEFGDFELLNTMNTFWIAQGQLNKEFWAHEFSKHATCTSCFDPKCYSDYIPHQEVPDFFHAALRAYFEYPTGQFLAAAGILPNNKTTYALQDIQNAIYLQTGSTVYLGCSGENNNILDEVWYYQHVWGCSRFGHFKLINATDESDCADQVYYYERTPSSIRDYEVDYIAYIP